MNRLASGISAFVSQHAVWLAFGILLLLAILNQLQVDVIHEAQTLGIARQTAFRELISEGDETPTLASLGSPYLGYVNVGFEFRASDMGGNPNLFQTGPSNAGIRAEFAGDSLSIVFPCESTPNHLKGLCIADKLEAGRWYRLEFEALDGEFLNCRVSGYSPFRGRLDRPHFSAGDIRVGTGFDESRRFHGELRHVTVTALNARTLGSARRLVYSLQIVLMAAFAAMLYVFYRNAGPAVAKIASTARSFYDPLLTLRFVACLMVLAGHALMITHLPADLKTSLAAGSPAWLLTASPWGGVWIFFTLSGYLMGKGFYCGRYTPDGPGIWNFYRNRLLRIAPLYWVSILLVAALVRPEYLQLKNLGNLIAILTFNCDSFASGEPIGALWSVRTEMQFYALVPFFYICVARRLKSVAVMTTVALALLAGGIALRTATVETLGWEFWHFEVYKTLFGNLDLFLLGFLANPLVQWLKSRITSGKYLIELGMLLLVATYGGLAWLSAQGGLLLVPEWRRVLFEMGPTLTAIATTAVIVCFDTKPNHSGQLVARLGKRTEVFGLLTYAIYVWHEPILIAAAKNQPSPETLSLALQSLGTSCIVILAVSLVMNYAIERPFERMKSHTRSAGLALAQTLRLSDVGQDGAPPSATPATDLRRSA